MKLAPWTDEEVAHLNEWQHSQLTHPFTCGNRKRETHPFEEEYYDFGVLRATRDGWVCPYCKYTQNWAHDFMFKKIPDSLKQFEEKLKNDTKTKT